MLEAVKHITKLGFLFGHKLHPKAAQALAEVVLNGGWTSAELQYAAEYIPTDEQMCETVTYNRTINPTVFAKVRKVPAVLRGRTFGYQEALAYSQEQGVTFSELFGVFRHGERTVFALK